MRCRPTMAPSSSSTPKASLRSPSTTSACSCATRLVRTTCTSAPTGWPQRPAATEPPSGSGALPNGSCRACGAGSSTTSPTATSSSPTPSDSARDHPGLRRRRFSAAPCGSRRYRWCCGIPSLETKSERPTSRRCMTGATATCPMNEIEEIDDLDLVAVGDLALERHTDLLRDATRPNVGGEDGSTDLRLAEVVEGMHD